jgi:hypothetical protein
MRGPYPVDVTGRGVQDIWEKHTPEGPYSGQETAGGYGRGVFAVPEGLSPEEFKEWITENITGPAEWVKPEPQDDYPTWARTVDTGDVVGYDREGYETTEYTVITTPSTVDPDRHDLVNAFPGEP